MIALILLKPILAEQVSDSSENLMGVECLQVLIAFSISWKISALFFSHAIICLLVMCLLKLFRNIMYPPAVVLCLLLSMETKTSLH